MATASHKSTRLRRLGDRIASLAAHIDASTHKLLAMIAEFDRDEGWKAGSHASCAHWLSWRIGIDLGTAREKVRAARALEHLPQTSEALSKGAVSYSKARALTRVATKENEGELLNLALTGSVEKLERAVRSWKRHGRLDEQELEKQRHESRTLSVFPDGEGMYLIRGRLDPEVGAVLMRAIDAATDELYRSERRETDERRQTEEWRQTEERRETDERRQTGDRRATEERRQTEKRRATDDDERTISLPRQRRADALGLVAERALAAAGNPTRADRYQVTLHVDADTLSEDREPGTSELEDGTRISAETSRRLSCDAGLVVMKHGSDGRVLDVGRKTRTVPPAIRRALRARDRGCAFPGCGGRYTESHHARHWANGGGTKLRNLISLCRRHHRAVHEGGCRVVMSSGGRAEFYDRSGVLIPEAPGVSPAVG